MKFTAHDLAQQASTQTGRDSSVKSEQNLIELADQPGGSNIFNSIPDPLTSPGHAMIASLRSSIGGGGDDGSDEPTNMLSDNIASRDLYASSTAGRLWPSINSAHLSGLAHLFG